MLISGGIPSMAHWCFWLSPSPQLFFFVLFCFVKVVKVVLAYFISLFTCYAVK